MVSVSRARPLLGTFVVVSAEGSRSAVDRGLAQAFEAVEAVERRMSYFNPTSDVSRLNREAYKSPVHVHGQTYRVLRQAQQLSLLSNGIFDVTIAGVLVREGFLPEGEGPGVDLRANFTDIWLGPGRRVRFRRSLRIDLGGIAKGFAVDQALSALRRANVIKGWVNAGGDMAFFSDRAENILVRHPEQSDKMVSLGHVRQGALASSAPAYRSRGRAPYVCEGKTIRSYSSVTVAAPRACWADGLTKIALLAPEMAPALLKKFRSRACVISPMGKRVKVREVV